MIDHYKVSCFEIYGLIFENEMDRRITNRELQLITKKKKKTELILLRHYTVTLGPR